MLLSILSFMWSFSNFDVRFANYIFAQVKKSKLAIDRNKKSRLGLRCEEQEQLAIFYITKLTYVADSFITE